MKITLFWRSVIMTPIMKDNMNYTQQDMEKMRDNCREVYQKEVRFWKVLALSFSIMTGVLLILQLILISYI